MPEGDTIFKVARALHAALAGQPVTGLSSPRPEVEAAARRLGLVGRRVERVEARGKHLLIVFEGGAALHTHLRMNGSWHLYRPGSRWRQARERARVVLETAVVHAVCFAAPTVELLSKGALARHAALLALGPDLLDPGFDEAAARQRLRARAGVEIAVALLDQTALAGVGNVYKSEVLFLCGVSPFARVETLTDAQLDELIATARALLKRNVGPGPRRTTSGLSRERLSVYERGGRPCRRCGTTVERRRQGEDARSTWFCPRCQVGGAPPLRRPDYSRGRSHPSRE